MKPVIKIKRAYEAVERGDGYRVLVDRLWPRGIAKDKLDMDAWIKDVAPSTELRKWFNHAPERWTEFQHRYNAELKNNVAVDTLIEQLQSKKNITLLYGAKDEEHNQAVVLKHFIEARL